MLFDKGAENLPGVISMGDTIGLPEKNDVPHLCFDRASALKMGFPCGAWGTATVSFDRYVLSMYGLEGNPSRARLLSVSDVQVQGTDERGGDGKSRCK